MNIGIDIRTIGRERTGDETYTLELTRRLFLCGEKNSYFLYTDTKNEQELKTISSLLNPIPSNAKIISVSPASKFLWTFFSLPRQARRDKIDVLHVQYITPLIFSKNITLLATIHDVSFERFPQYIGKKDLFFLKTLIPLSLKKASGIIAVSEFTKREIIDCYSISPEKIVVINNGCDTELFKKDISEKTIEDFKSRYNLKKPFLFYVGTLQPRKNIPFLIRGFAEFKKQHSNDEQVKDLHLIIGGALYGNNYDPEIGKEMEKINEPKIKKDIRFVGYIKQSDLPKFYHCAQAYLSASLYEGFSLSLIEAMASKTPVICSDSSCHSEIAGNAAEIFENNNKESFHRALLSVLNDKAKREALIKKGIARSQQFSWKKNALQTLEFYDIMAKAKAR
ncbi:MAG: glycosyltransferase family 1 protein [Patescibacteria group bacterium]|nr:glycosyltransferase family 1 protein [Patescibacteria group bacterium]